MSSAPFGHHMLEHWPLQPGVTYLNHGTVGVTPRRVLDVQQALRDEMERQPSRFMLREVAGLVGGPRPGPTRVRAAVADVAHFVGASDADVVFVENATSAINAVLRSLPLAAGDEVLLTDHVYGSNILTARAIAGPRGASVRTVEVPYPAFDAGRFVAAVRAAITPRTRLVLLEHITSESGLILPVREVAAVCRELGVPVLVDAAHAPGQVPLDLPSLGVDWYAANLHKWALAPRSCGFLWTAPARQADTHPAVISWGYGEGYLAEFAWAGTRDPTPWLAAPAGIAFLGELGADAMWDYNHGLAWRAAEYLTTRWGTRLEFSERDIAFMATVPLPASLGSTANDATRLRTAVLDEDGIEVQMHAWGGSLWARVSVQVYIAWEDIERFAEVILRRAEAAARAS